ncbi:hypothetical protein HDU96_005287, partial [Phlyctochytrium bullatum]
MPSTDDRYVVLMDPSDAFRVVYALRFELPADRLTGPAVFHPVVLTTLDTRDGGFSSTCSGESVDVAALTALNPGFPDHGRRRRTDDWPLYWEALASCSRPSSTLHLLTQQLGAQQSFSRVLVFGTADEFAAN